MRTKMILRKVSCKKVKTKQKRVLWKLARCLNKSKIKRGLAMRREKK